MCITFLLKIIYNKLIQMRRIARVIHPRGSIQAEFIATTRGTAFRQDDVGNAIDGCNGPLRFALKGRHSGALCHFGPTTEIATWHSITIERTSPN